MDVKHFMTIDGKSSKDFNMYISGGGTYLSPERVVEEVEIPGRNGVMFVSDGSYENAEISYDCFIGKEDGEKEVDRDFRNLRSFLLSRNGYFRLEDTYHPDEIRFATFNEDIDPDVHESLQLISFTLTFSAKPERFLKKYYDIPITYTSSGSIFNNETYFDAKPLIR